MEITKSRDTGLYFWNNQLCLMFFLACPSDTCRAFDPNVRVDVVSALLFSSGLTITNKHAWKCTYLYSDRSFTWIISNWVTLITIITIVIWKTYLRDEINICSLSSMECPLSFVILQWTSAELCWTYFFIKNRLSEECIVNVNRLNVIP